MGQRKTVKRKAKLPKLGVEPGRGIEQREQRTATLTIRLTPTQRQQVRRMANRFGTTVTNYLMSLHGQAWETVQEKEGER